MDAANWREDDKGRLVARGVISEDGISSEGGMDVNMEEKKVVDLTSEKEEVVLVERTCRRV